MYQSFRAASLDGQRALVTGAASGIGKATACLLAGLGASVVAADVDSAGAEDTVALIEGDGGAAVAKAVDLASAGLIRDFAEQVHTECGTLDILVNAAGITGRNAMETTLEQWERVMTVNLTSPFLLLQAVAKRMIATGTQGSIVNVSSSSAFRARGNGGAYGASKAGLQSLTRSAAWELGPYGIRVNTVAPGVTRTPMAIGGSPEKDLDELVSTGYLANLLGRVSEPEDLANVIVFLCLPASRQITAQVIQVSAGAVVCAG